MVSLRAETRFAASSQEFDECDCAHCDCLTRVLWWPRRKVKAMVSMLSLMTVDIVGLLAALSIWTASFVLMLPSRRL
jgi:hypothetical protein